MEFVDQGAFVAIAYDLYDVTDAGNETLLHQVPVEQSEKIVYGVTPHVIEPLLAAIKGLKQGEKFEVTIAPADGFGEYSEQMVQTEVIPREVFEVDGKIDEKRVFPGAQIFLQTNVGQEVPAVVLSIDDTTVSVKVDFNHPLAGRTIKLRGNVVEVRQATDNEIAEHTRMGQCGCGGGCSGGNCGDGCGNGCCDGCGE